MTGIYYSDLFLINNCGCLIMGYGKSKTCRRYTGEDTIEICSDSIRLERIGNKLFGYADPGMGILPFNKEMAKSAQIKYLVRMLNEEETQELKCDKIIEIKKKNYIRECTFNITYGVFDKKERLKEFERLIEDVDLKCILVPWCTDMEAKGRLISQYVK